MALNRTTDWQSSIGTGARMSDRSVYLAVTVATVILVALMVWLLFL